MEDYVMVIMIHTLTWGVISEERVGYKSMQSCKEDLQIILSVLPQDEFGMDTFLICEKGVKPNTQITNGER